jgi:hypothetical protein
MMAQTQNVSKAVRATRGRGMLRGAACLAVLSALLLAFALPAGASDGETFPEVFSLPEEGLPPEGIAVGRGSSF